VLCGRKDTVIRRRLGVGPAVRGERKSKTAQRLLKSDMAENGIGAYAHDLGVEVGKAGEIRLDSRQFVLSNRCKVKGVEANHHVLAAIGGKLKFALGRTCRRTEPEIRRWVSDL